MNLNNLFKQDIKLIKDNHRYEHVEDPNFEFISVTTFVDQFFKGFDAKKVAKKLIRKYSKYSDYTVESLIKEWEETAKYGTYVHEEIENWIRYNSYPKEIKSINGINWLKNYKLKSEYKIFPEMIIYSKQLKIAGTIDVLALDKKTNQYDLIDWKTSKKIETSAFGGKVGTKPATNTIPDCNYSHYTLQLSLYRYMLEEYYGLAIKNQFIAHLKEDYARGIEVPYMKDQIIKMLGK